MTQTLSQKLGFATHRSSDIVLAFAVLCMTMLLVIPLTPLMLDALVSLSIVLGVTTLLVTLYTEEPLSFSSFPSLLLIITLFRLGLNIAATRMILTEAQAGEIIKTFGDFVTGGNQLVGFLIFILITGVNFLVITKGSGRIAEVAARFYLDALPGKQMAVDADLNAGAIHEQEAQQRREKIIAESDFYGAMDGASKFVRGDAIAGMIITVVNTVGSLIIGLGIRGLSWDEVVHTYITLTVGDGLVTQIPALLISVGAGIIVTRSSSKQHLSDLFRLQMFNNPKVLTLTAMILAVLSIIPGMPKIVMLTIAAAIYFYANSLKQSQNKLKSGAQKEMEFKELEKPLTAKAAEKIVFIDLMELEFGEKLSSLVEGPLSKALETKISAIRKQVAADLGIVVPFIHVHHNPFLPPDGYLVKIKGNEVDSGVLHLDDLLAVNPGHITRKLAGIQTLEPAFKLAATWIEPHQKQHAEALGYAVADPLSVLSTHLTEIIHSHAYELINRQEVSLLVDHAKTYAPAVVEELIPGRLSLGDVLKVLQNLLRERISIRDMISILEILADNSNTTKDIEILTEYVRIGLARSISKQYMDQNRTIHAITIDSKVEQLMIEGMQKNEFGKQILINPSAAQNISTVVREIAINASAQGVQAVVLTSSALRPYLKKFIERSLPGLPVLAFGEITREIQVMNLGVISQDVLYRI